jgi:Cu2+-containing amine oxidase
MIKNTAEASLESVNEIDLVQSEIKKELLNLREGIVNNDEKFYELCKKSSLTVNEAKQIVNYSNAKKKDIVEL